MFTSTTSKSLLAGLFAAVAFAAPASADSVVYLQGGDVHLTTTDISRQFQVTFGGGYSAVSQADDGTILATTTAGKLRRLDRQGDVLSEVGSIAGGSAAFSFKGPFDADISPNGEKLAYGYTYSGYTNTNGGTYVNEGNATAFAKAATETNSSEAGFKSSREYDAPEWVDDQRVLVSNGPGYPSNPLAVVEAGSGGSRSWFTDPENMHPHDATLSRNWRMLAMTNGDRNGLYVYRDKDALLLGDVNACFYYTPDTAGQRYASPTFNENGSLLFWANGNGLEVAPVGDTRVTCPDGLNSRQVLPGASSPDWGPADVPAPRPVQEEVKPAPAPTPGPVPNPAPGPGLNGKGPSNGSVGAKGSDVKPGNGSGPAAGGGTIDAGSAGAPGSSSIGLSAKAGALRGTLSAGLSVTVTAPGAGQVSVSALSGKTVVAAGSTTVKAGTPKKFKLTFTKTARRKLARSGKVTLTLTAKQGGVVGTTKLTLRK